MSDVDKTLFKQFIIQDAKFAFFQLTFLMIGLSLLVDTINGFFLSGIGIDPKLSALFKLILLSLMLFQIGAYAPRLLASILLFFFMMLLGPAISFYTTVSLAGFVDDFTSGLKIYTAMIVFIYIALVCHRWPSLVLKYGKWCLVFAFIVLSANMLLGVLGFGFSSYGNADSESSSAIGIKGFFYAANEVSGIFIVLFGSMLHLLWQKRKFVYVLFSPFVLLTALLIATKAAMLAAALLIFAIPLFNERHKLLNLTWLKVRMILPFIVVMTILLIVLVPIFESTGLWNRFVWFYEKKGIIGIILSGRDVFIISALDAYMRYANLADILFGFSKTGLGMITKNAMEIDPIDMYLWHGVFGIVLFLAYLAVFFRVSYLSTMNRNSIWGPAVLLINIALFAVSMIAGHIFTSGMLAPLLGLINGMAYADYILSGIKEFPLADKALAK
jgi:hypothetical protein